MKIIKTFLFLMCAVVITPAQATTIYSQTWDGTSEGMSAIWDTNPAQTVSSVTDPFSLDPSISYAYVNNIGWWGRYSDNFNPSPNNFYIELGTFDSQGNATDFFTIEGAVTVTPASPTSSPQVSFYSLDLPDAVKLFGGVSYYIWIQAEYDVDLSQIATSSWLWAYDTSNPVNGGFTYDNIDFVNGPLLFDRHTAFVLNGTVPEPATIWLMMLALAGMVVVRRRSAAGECKLSA